MKHVHCHGRDGQPRHQRYAARRHPEAVVLDLGGDIGALIIHTEADMHGVEVEISASGQDDARSHKEVLEREINGQPAYTAVFDNVREGSYTLWVDDVARERDVVVSGGAVARLDWAACPPGGRPLADTRPATDPAAALSRNNSAWR
jgi:hypothetical protein